MKYVSLITKMISFYSKKTMRFHRLNTHYIGKVKKVSGVRKMATECYWHQSGCQAQKPNLETKEGNRNMIGSIVGRAGKKNQLKIIDVSLPIRKEVKKMRKVEKFSSNKRKPKQIIKWAKKFSTTKKIATPSITHHNNQRGKEKTGLFLLLTTLRG